MAQGDLTLATGAFRGPGKGVAVGVPSGGTLFQLTADAASFWDKAQTDNVRVKVSAGLSFPQVPGGIGTLTTGSGAQIYCPNGSWTIDGSTWTGANRHLHPSGNGFIGKLIIKNSIGQSGQSNNSGTAIDLDDATYDTGLYFFSCAVDQNPAIATMSGDEPECINCFRGSAQPNWERNVTFDRFYVPTFVDGTKMFTGSAGSTNSAENTLIGWWRGYAYVDRRNPRGNDGMNLDFQNWVQPQIAHGIQAGFDTRSSLATATILDIDECWIESNENGDPTFLGDIDVESGVTVGYIGGVENNSPTVDWNGGTPNATSQTTAVYTAKGISRDTAATMDGTLRAAILAETATSYAVTEAPPIEPPATLDPIGAGQNLYNAAKRILGPGVLQTVIPRAWLPLYERIRPTYRWLPGDRRAEDAIFGGCRLKRWSNAMQGWIVEPTWMYPGLQPEFEGMMPYDVPEQRIWALGGI